MFFVIIDSFIVLAINCGEPVSITNGDVSYSSTIVDSLATYSCNNGYTLVGDSDTVKCTNSGEWEGSIPACIGTLQFLATTDYVVNVKQLIIIISIRC